MALALVLMEAAAGWDSYNDALAAAASDLRRMVEANPALNSNDHVAADF
jgi:hypothetical protein